MASRMDPARARQLAAALKPGAVLHLLQPLIGKHKFHVLIAASAERSLGFLINSRIGPFIQNRPDLLSRQVSLPVAANPFMHHDSIIACHDTVRLPPLGELIAGLADRSMSLVGYLHHDLLVIIAAAAAGSPLIAARDAELIATGFAVR